LTQNQFLKKYKGKEFYIDRVEIDETPVSMVKVDNKALPMNETDLFWTLYQESETVFSDPNLEIVKF
jgi:hypothetical protein